MNQKSNSQKTQNPIALSNAQDVRLHLRFQKVYSLDSKKVNDIADKIGYVPGIFFDRGRGKICIDCYLTDDGTLVVRNDCQQAEKDMFAGFLVQPESYYRAICREQLFVNTERKMVKATLFAGPNGEKLRPITTQKNILFIFGERQVFLTGEFDGVNNKFRLSRTVILGNKVYSQVVQWWKYIDLTNNASDVIRYLEKTALAFCGSATAAIADFVITGMVVAYNQIQSDESHWATVEQLDEYPVAQQIDVPQQTGKKNSKPVHATSGSSFSEQLKNIRPKVVADSKEAVKEAVEEENSTSTPKTRKSAAKPATRRSRKTSVKKSEPAEVTISATA
ncbi:MAG: hypothetical protein ABH884_03525 [Candidatus Komeilibacteria bacterium]